MILAVAWRNIWRNKLRSSVMITAISIGIFAGIYSWAFVQGMMNQRVDSAIRNEASHIQIHHLDYKQNPDKKFFMPNGDEVAATVAAQQGVDVVSERVKVQAMVSSAETGTGVVLVGIDTTAEARVTDIHRHIIEGQYLQGISRNPILIGEKLANKLNVRVRSKVVISLQKMDGEIVRAQFRVAGIYKTSNTMYDGMNAFVGINDLRNLVGLGATSAHEIAIMVDPSYDHNGVAEKLKDKYPDLDIKTWEELMPEVSVITDSLDIWMLFMMGIILIGLGFAIVNTMLMAILERVKELGMLMAIGMSKHRVFRMIVLETILLSLSGMVVGAVIAVFLSWLSARNGLDMSQWSEGIEAIGYDTIIYPVLEIRMIVIVAVLVIVTAVLASISPALKALRLKPAEAIRTDN